MADNPGMQPAAKPKEDLLKCPVCDSYFKKEEGFYCPKCKRGPHCRRHRVKGRRECVSCVLDLKSRELTQMHDQKENISGFLKFIHFLFLLFAVFYVAYNLNMAQQIELLNNEFISENLIYFGIVIMIGYIFFFIILYSQKRSIQELQNQIEKMRKTFS